jgi:hypothetical protein
MSRINEIDSDSGWEVEPPTSFVVPNHRRIIPPLLGERAGVRAVSLQPRHEVLVNRISVRRWK